MLLLEVTFLLTEGRKKCHWCHYCRSSVCILGGEKKNALKLVAADWGEKSLTEAQHRGGGVCYEVFDSSILELPDANKFNSTEPRQLKNK